MAGLNFIVFMLIKKKSIGTGPYSHKAASLPDTWFGILPACGRCGKTKGEDVLERVPNLSETIELAHCKMTAF